MVKKITTYNICTISNEESTLQDLAVSTLDVFQKKHSTMLFPHRHTFYQILFIERGGGVHIIDFEKFDVKEATIFLLCPGQVHKWVFTKGTNGIIINFSDSFFSTFLANRSYVNDFLFFSGNPLYSCVDLTANNELKKSVGQLMNRILREYSSCDDCKLDLIRVLILQVLFDLNREITEETYSRGTKHNYHVLRKFQKLVDLHYPEKRMPKDYAELLCVTPNYLNILCSHLTGSSAGEIIRNRILLEAKRLLINSELPVCEIAWQLHFKDNSYFSRFFKKYQKTSPEEFRRIWNQTL